jgi:hypothetical protein
MRLRKIDQKITQADDPADLLWHLQVTLNVAHQEAKLAFQRQLENYEILETRIKQIRDALPKPVILIPKRARVKEKPKPLSSRAKLIENSSKSERASGPE